jgi:hypothetical protein
MGDSKSLLTFQPRGRWRYTRTVSILAVVNIGLIFLVRSFDPAGPWWERALGSSIWLLLMIPIFAAVDIVSRLRARRRDQRAAD